MNMIYLILMSSFVELNYIFEFIIWALVILSLILLSRIFRKNKIGKVIGTIAFFLLNCYIFITILFIIGSISFYEGEINGYPTYSRFNPQAFLYQNGFFSLILMIVITMVLKKHFLPFIGILENREYVNIENSSINNKEKISDDMVNIVIPPKSIVINPPSEEHVSRNISKPHDLYSLKKILFIFFTVCGVGFAIFLWYSTLHDNEVIIEEGETTMDTIIYKKVEDYIYEMNSGQTKIFSVKDHPKAHGADWQMKIPTSWNILQGERSHVIIKLGTNDFNPHVNMAISSHKLPLHNGQILTPSDIEDFFGDNYFFSNIVHDRGNFVSGKKIVVDGLPGYMAEIESMYKNIDNEIKMKSLNFFFIVDNVLFNLICNVSTADLKEDLSIKMSQHKDFFKIVANTIIINRSLIEEKRNENIPIPTGYRMPNKDDITVGTDWFNFRDEKKVPYYTEGYFNEDNILDYACLLINISTNELHFFCFMSNAFGIETVFMGNYGYNYQDSWIMKYDRGENICSDDELINRPIKYDGIATGAYEKGDVSVYEYNIDANSFSVFWACPSQN
ncbi:MAG: hypothetical protein IPN79_09885 [Saprospiraceae bacterium]|nr:hypothetical protein [Saprospiraceae bacterium]